MIGATTTLLAVERFVQPGDFPDNPVILTTDRTVFLSDFAVGLRYDITGAQYGDTWNVEWVDPAGTVVAGSTLRFLQTFLGQTDCFVFGLIGPSLCGGNFITAQSASTAIHCGTVGPWRMNLLYNASLVSAEQVMLASSGARAEVSLNPQLITPQVIGGFGIPNISPGLTTVTVRVSDSGCPNSPVPGASVALVSRTVPGSGGHAHLGSQTGTGRFSVSSGTTDRSGNLTGITYTAGLVGLEEDIIAGPTGSGAIVPGQARLTIAVQAAGITLLPLAQSNLYVQRQSPTGAQRHPQNNYGTPHVVTQRIPVLAEKFLEERRQETGQTAVLSFNDISLPFGGMFDINGLLTTAAGHVSHEVGIDFDVNTSDSNSVPLSDADVQSLRELAERGQVGCRWIHRIHFRCDRAALVP